MIMLKRDAVKTALDHRQSDIVPFCIRLTGEAHNAYDDMLLRDYADPTVLELFGDKKISRTEAVEAAIGNFMMDCPFPWWGWDYAHMPPAYGDPDEVPDVMPPVVDNNKEDVARICAAHTGFLRETFGVYTTALIWGSHWEKAYFTRGIQNMLADFAGAPEFVENLLKFIVDKNMGYLERITSEPCYDGILLGSDWGTQNDLIISPKSWRELIMPGEKRQYEIIHAAGKQVMVHSCGCIYKVMDELVELGVDILNPVQPECMDLALLKEKYGDHMTFWGGISTQRVLPYGEPKEVSAETERVIKLMSRNGGYITSPSQEIQTDVPYENLRAMIDTARYYAGM